MLVSCLTVTQAGRESFFSEARRAFEEQSYAEREHVVVRQPLTNPPTLGELRNQSLDLARGDLVCQWDDDDLYHRDRIAAQVQRLKETAADVCFIEQVTLRCHCGFEAVSGCRAWENTMLVKASALEGVRYPSLGRGEDTSFVGKLDKKGIKMTLLRRPDLYIYRVHRTNTWNPMHFDFLFMAASVSHRPSTCLRNIP